MLPDLIWKSIFWSGWLIFGTCIVIISLGTPDGTELQFYDFIKKYNKSYSGGTEYYERLEIFRKTLTNVHLLNANRTGPESAFYGITQFADLTPTEFKAAVLKPIIGVRMLQRYNLIQNTNHRNHKRDTIPLKVDWRDQGIVTSVKNQGQCGACWAFSTVETIESMNALKGGHLVELSVQQVTDCAGNGNYGCSGGDTCSVLEWLTTNDIYVLTETEYPLDHKTEPCRIKKPKKGVHIASNFTCANFNGQEFKMTELLSNHGPIVATVDAQTWQYYLGGIIQFHCEYTGNHAVQVIGYDKTNDVPYYIVRNSWGTDFGVNGYLYIAIGSNLCGIANEVSTLNVL